MDACIQAYQEERNHCNKGRTPYFEKEQSGKKQTYGQNIVLNEAQRIIVISGPNAGGKSITLKHSGFYR